MGLESSPDTFLRLLHRTPDEQHPPPRILGEDDFSFLRAKTFGTILIDLEKRMPVDLLPDREAETFAAWLRLHLGVELISRDRGGAYAEGARQGAPQAQQVADRFHLLVNLSETLEAFFLNKRAALKEAVSVPQDQPPSDEGHRAPRLWHKGVTKKQEEKSLHPHQERVERYHRVHNLHHKKADVADIARELQRRS